MSDWKTQVGERLISAEAAANFVQSGQTVAFTLGRESYAIGLAIASRMGELENVHIITPNPGYDLGWFDEGWQDAFDITIVMPTGTCQEAIDARRIDMNPSTPFNAARPLPWLRDADIYIVEISPPDAKGICSFGQSLWNKKTVLLNARARGKIVIAEINENLIRTYGDNFIHISDIDYFVEHQTSGAQQATGTLAGRAKKAPEPYLKDIARNVSTLIRDGDTLQIGVGRTTEPLVPLGVFDSKQDLGYHSEATPAGIISLIRQGVINGRLKNMHRGKAVVTSLGGGTKDEMEWARSNPIFELVDMNYLGDIRTIASNDNMVALNNILAIDLTGQTTAEALGPKILSVPGGQPPFHIGATHSKGGRAIQVLPSTAMGGKISRIMPELPLGSVVTIPRYYVDYVVTEYGIANLWAKSLRERAEALIAIAHPDFRDELRAAAKARFWP